MQLNKKQLVLVFLVILLLLCCSPMFFGSGSSALSNEDFIRFHVIANSNTSEDQRLKLMVRDGLIKSINEGLLAETIALAESGQEQVSLDMNNSKEFLIRNLEKYEKEAEEILLESGLTYPVKADLGVLYIPQKTYGEIVFPAGNYQALTVTIGEGRGENWWCVLFPPLCLIDSEPKDKDEENDTNDIYEEILREAIWNDRYKVLNEDGEKPKVLKLKFKVLELIKEK